MSLDFCCNIQMVGSILPCLNDCLNATAYLSIVADHVHPFMTTVYPFSDGYFQQDNTPYHKAQIISDWFLEHDNEFTFTQMASTVTRSQSNRAPLGCGGTGDSHHGCAADKSAETVMLSCQYGPISQRNVSNTLLNRCHKDVRQFWRQKGSNPVLARCT